MIVCADFEMVRERPMPTPNIKECPVCNSALSPGVLQCPNCGTDLRMLSPESDLAVEFYNQGLDCVDDGDRKGAIDKMKAAIATDPEMTDAYIVLGKLLARSGTPSETQEAIDYWEQAKTHKPDAEQAHTIETCLNSADRVLELADQKDRERRRNLIGGGVLGFLGLAGILTAGVLLFNRNQGAGAKPAGVPASNTGSNAMDPVAATKQALKRPDISVVNKNNSILLGGKTTTEAEKRSLVNAAQFAARLPVDASGIHVKLAPASRASNAVSTGQVQRMLNAYVAGSSSDDPLHGAKLNVNGGNGAPLKITGYCYNDRAGMKSANLIRSVFPKADIVDTSGIAFRAESKPANKPVAIARTFVPKRSVKQNKDAEPETRPAALRMAKRKLKKAKPEEVLVLQQTEFERRRKLKLQEKSRDQAKLLANRRDQTKLLAHRRDQAKLYERRQLQAKLEPGSEDLRLSSQEKEPKIYAHRRSADPQTYTVRSGDTLYSITRKFGRKPSEWKTLWKRNSSAVVDSSSLSAGAALSLPPGWHMRMRGDR